MNLSGSQAGPLSRMLTMLLMCNAPSKIASDHPASRLTLPLHDAQLPYPFLFFPLSEPCHGRGGCSATGRQSAPALDPPIAAAARRSAPAAGWNHIQYYYAGSSSATSRSLRTRPPMFRRTRQGYQLAPTTGAACNRYSWGTGSWPHADRSNEAVLCAVAENAPQEGFGDGTPMRSLGRRLSSTGREKTEVLSPGMTPV